MKITIELLDENNNSYIKSNLSNKYSFYENNVFIIGNIFYNFEDNVKKLKLIMKFNKIENYITKLWYVPTNNHRLVIKNYST